MTMHVYENWNELCGRRMIKDILTNTWDFGTNRICAKTSFNTRMLRNQAVLDVQLLSLHLHPFFVYTSRDSSGESAHMCRLT